MKIKKNGDLISINGDYQYNAAINGNPVQRFWHYGKKLAIKKYLPPLPSDYIIDVGCGSGVITSFLGESGADVIGIDSNLQAITFAKNHFQNNNVQFRQGLVDENFQIGRLVDKIYCLEVIEHIYYNQGKQMLKEFYRILKPNGKVFLTTPNYRSLWPIIEWIMDRFHLAPPLAKYQHVEHYHTKKLKELCLEVGFKIKIIKTNYLFAPWVAPFSWKLAEKINNLEGMLSFGGSILIFILVK
jgi:2-polyprenyl-3-methyl-5-hydroxy-6-metoxy-1,4-benzoquinol methylase